MKRPHVILNAAMTLDGKIATKAGRARLSGEQDWKEVHKIRAEVDAILVGINTVLIDNPRLTVHSVKDKNPIRVIADSKARTPLNARILGGEAKTIIAVSKQASPSKIKKLQRAKAEVIIVGEEKVNLPTLLENLRERGVEKLLLEGGATLNWSMLNEGLVDEIRVAISPRIIGGKTAPTLVNGEGYTNIRQAISLELGEIKRMGPDLILTYQVRKDG